MDKLAARIERVRERIAAAALRSGRRPEEVTLVAVTKTVSPEAIVAASQLGLRDFGENRVQEAGRKIPLVREGAPARIRWHMVGHLQTNKARRAASLFDIIQSVDSLRVAQALSKGVAKGARLPVLFQVNCGAGEGSSGVALQEVQSLWGQVCTLDALHIVGLMTIAPFGISEADTRGVFRRTRELKESLEQVSEEARRWELSMGMTDDFEIAIEEGATMVRIGRAIFGERT